MCNHIGSNGSICYAHKYAEIVDKMTFTAGILFKIYLVLLANLNWTCATSNTKQKVNTHCLKTKFWKNKKVS